MKKTRIVASLLCIMMIVCALPMMASAAPTANLAAAVAEVLGYSDAAPAVSDNNWPTTNLDFTTEDAANTQCLNATGITFNTTDGAVFGEENGKLYYQPRELSVNKVAVWSPFAVSYNVTFGFKLNKNGHLQVSGEEIWGSTQMGVELYENRVGVWESTGNQGAGTLQLATNLVDYKPGTEWNDVLVTKDVKSANTGGYTVYMKKASDKSFTKVAVSNSFCYCTKFGDCYNGGLKINGTSAAVNYAVSYKETGNPVYRSIDDIAGSPVASAYAFDFNSEFDLDDWSHGNGAMKTSPEGVSLSDDNGLTLTNGASWNFYAFEFWSPLNSGPAWAEADYRAQMAYIKTKGIMKILMDAPGLNDGKAVSLDFTTATGIIGNGGGTNATTFPSVTYQDEWMEYLVVPKATGWNAGYSLYAKGEKSTGGRWTKVSDTKAYGGGSNKTTGITLTGNGGSVKEIRLYKQAITETANQDATFKWYGEEMTEQHSYNNLSQSGVVYSDGFANFPAGGATSSMTMTLAYAPIPVGGYAEFRTRSNGAYAFVFYDGEKVYSVTIQKDYTTIPGSSDYIGEGNSTWRTWRIARTEEGYIAYCQVEGDTGWLETNVVSSAATNTPAVQMKFYGAQSNSQNTKAQLDYLRIYGPAPENKLTVTNGVGTLVMKDGDKAGYGIIRPIVTAETGKLLLVHYNGENMVKASIYNVEDMTEQQFMYTNVSGADRYKVFLWDNFNGLNKLAPAMTFGL